MSRVVRFSPLRAGVLGVLLLAAPHLGHSAELPLLAHTITTAASAARFVFAADVDGDGDIDVLSASYDDNKIAWYENDGSEAFTPRTITTAAAGASSVFAADVDGDGDTDVLSASRFDDKIAWYENDLPLFCDGFESGDVSAWSGSVP